jgi:hypothetical protein
MGKFEMKNKEAATLGSIASFAAERKRVWCKALAVNI